MPSELTNTERSLIIGELESAEFRGHEREAIRQQLIDKLAADPSDQREPWEKDLERFENHPKAYAQECIGRGQIDIGEFFHLLLARIDPSIVQSILAHHGLKPSPPEVDYV